MDFVTAVKTCLITKYATFTGRASRSEFWFYFLFHLLAGLIAASLGSAFSQQASEALVSVLSLVLFLPSLAVAARRLHDINKSAWFLLLHLIPLLGSIIVLIFSCLKGTAGANRFGDSVL